VAPRNHQPSEGGQIVFLNRRDVNHKSPDSGERQYDHGPEKKRIVPALRAGGRTSNLDRNVLWYRGGLVFEAHILLYHSA